MEPDTFLPIKVKKFINPHLFFFKLDLSTVSENKLQKHIDSHPQTKEFSSRHAIHEPKLHELVLAFVMPSGKWVRAQVDLVLQQFEGEAKYVLWLLDYGEVVARRLKYIRPMPEELKRVDPLVYRGGVANCFPASQSMEGVVRQNEWSKGSIKFVAKELEYAAEMKFKPTCKWRMNSSTDHLFGELRITTFNAKRIDLATVLEKYSFARIDADAFQKDILKMSTIKKSRCGDNESMLEALDFGTPVIIPGDSVGVAIQKPLGTIDARVFEWQDNTKKIAADNEREMYADLKKIVQEIPPLVAEVNTHEHLEAAKLASMHTRQMSGLMQASANSLNQFGSQSTLSDASSTLSRIRRFNQMRALSQKLMKSRAGGQEDNTSSNASSSTIPDAPSKPKSNACYIPAGHERDIHEFEKWNNICE